MNISSAAVLIRDLQTYGLLEPAQLDQLRQSPCANMDPRSLAGLLLRQDWLTAYQVNQLFTGSASGLVLGHYALLERLGSGSMGQVYKARNQRLGQIVALKVILKEYLSQPTALPRFRREIQVVAQLNHPNIVKAFDADVIDGTPFYTMEFCDGINFAKRVMRCGPLPIRSASDCVRQAALGLQHAFEKGIVHRDVKPSNLLLISSPLSPEGERGTGLVKLLDLGLAFVSAAESETSSMRDLTNPQLFVGTPDFAAPEQATDPHQVDTRSDLYSLGCTFYFLLTGIVPFPYGTPLNKLFRHRLEEPCPIQNLRAGIPPALGSIVHRLMAKEPAERHQTPLELVHDLEAFLAELPDDSETTRAVEKTNRPRGEKVSTAAGLPRRTTSRRRWLLAGSLTVLLLLGGGMLIGILQGGGTRVRSSPASVVQRTTAAGPEVRSYVRRPTRTETILATLQANGLPNLVGKWRIIGPFDSDPNEKGFETVYPPELEIRLDASYPGKGGPPVRWQEFPAFQLDRVVNLRLFEENDFAVVYLYHWFNTAAAVELPLSLGSDDTLTVWLNREQLLAKKVRRGVVPGDDHVLLRCKPGANELLLKICNHNGAWGVYVMPLFPPELERVFGESLRRDFARRAAAK